MWFNFNNFYMHDSEDHGIVDAPDAINENQDLFPV